MITIDADAHVVESELTWDFMDKADQKYRPSLVKPSENASTAYWLVEGKVRGLARAVLTEERLHDFTEKSGRNVVTTEETRSVENVEARLQHMDELGVDIQVLHSTIFIRRVADRPEVEIPICWGWNRWMADIWKRSNNRLRWSAVLPLLSIPHAIEQLQFAKQNGACAIFVRAIEGEYLLHDSYFFPLYEEASRLNMPIVVHVGNSNPYVSEFLSGPARMPSGVWSLSLQTVGAFHSWLLNGIWERFPELRFGVVECTASWLPYILNDVKRRFPAFGYDVPENIMRDARMYVSCQTDDDIPYLVSQGAEDGLMIGTDYGHTDNSSEIEALRNLQTSGKVAPEILQKVLFDNPRRFYGIGD